MSIEQACIRCGNSASMWCICFRSTSPYTGPIPYNHQFSSNIQSRGHGIEHLLSHLPPNEYQLPDMQFQTSHFSTLSQTIEQTHLIGIQLHGPHSLNYDPVVQIADTTSSHYGVTGASDFPASVTCFPRGYEQWSDSTDSQWKPAQPQYDPFPHSIVPQSGEWLNSHWDSTSHLSSYPISNDRLTQTILPLALLPVPLAPSLRVPGRRGYICPDCGKSLTSKQSVDHHIEGVHRKNNRYPCPHCGKTFPYPQSRNRHEKSRCPATQARQSPA